MTELSYPQPKPGRDDDPRLAIRRHTDRCFHRVEEIVPGPMGGYVVEGILIHRDDVAEVVQLDEHGSPMPSCETKAAKPS